MAEVIWNKLAENEWRKKMLYGLDEFGQLCSLENTTKEECFQAAKAKWRISKAVFNGLWRKAGIAQKQAHRPRTRRCKCVSNTDESPVKGI